MLTQKIIREKLATIIDPELNVDIVSLGLIYEINVLPTGNIHILMTLTSPGCPLAGMFVNMIKNSLRDIDNLNVNKNVSVELTFDPPWTSDMMSEEVKAELGF